MPDDKKTGAGFFEQYAEELVGNGYTVVPIPAGRKGPLVKDWQKTTCSLPLVKGWLRDGHGICGLGVLTTNTPAIDIDVKDKVVSERMAEWCKEHIGLAPVRVGSAPKQLLLYRSTAPFRKMMSAKYRDEWDELHRIEILGAGQQFVAYHIHPDTSRPYTWGKLNPSNTVANELTELTVNDARRALEAFEAMAEAEGWERVADGNYGGAVSSSSDDPFAADVEKVNVTFEQLREHLLMVPNAEDHERWVECGMALHHQFDGDYEGLDLWIEWSSTADNFDRKECEKRWRSFDIREKGRQPRTARTILKLAKEASEQRSNKLAVELTTKFTNVSSKGEWDKVVEQVRHAEIDHITRESLAETAQRAYMRITGSRISIAAMRKSMSFQVDASQMPTWCKGWVWDSDKAEFFHLETKLRMTKVSFDAAYDRFAMTKKDVLEGKGGPSIHASDLALSIYRVPVVNGRMYMPGYDALFSMDGRRFANSYPENAIPECPDGTNSADTLAINRVKDHFEHLIADERERELFKSWVAYVVQNPGKRVNWCPVLQGTEGDGKSFFAFLLRAVMGTPNVRMLNASSFASDFTGWAIGQCVVAVEELRLQGEGRFDVLNKIKPFITNSVIEVHKKGETQFDAPNTTNYLAFTNFVDALPLTDNDRRYFVLFSRWQSKDALARFRAEKPDYYQRLYEAIETAPGAIRQWLLNLDLCDEFNPKGDAPWTAAHDVMVRAAMPSQIHTLNEIIDSNEFADIGPELVSVTRFEALLGAEAPKTQGWKTLMARGGWLMVEGRVRFGDEFHRFYAKKPEKFTLDGSTFGKADSLKIGNYLRERQARIDALPPDDDGL